MDIDYAVGGRVRVSVDYHWAKGAAGTVQLPPASVTRLAPGWEGHVRRVQMRKGLMPFYWVVFDLPQHDADGDGPYEAGEIEAAYLTPSES